MFLSSLISSVQFRSFICSSRFYSVLFYVVLFCSILCCSILFYSMLFYSILFYSMLFYSVLFCTPLFFFLLFCSTFSILLFSVLFFSIFFYSLLLQCCDLQSAMELFVMLFRLMNSSGTHLKRRLPWNIWSPRRANIERMKKVRMEMSRRLQTAFQKAKTMTRKPRNDQLNILFTR